MKIKKKELKRLLKQHKPPRGESKHSKRFFKEKGFYSEDCWNLDITLAWFILPRLIYFKKNAQSFPAGFTNLDDWKDVLDKMIKAFYLILDKAYVWSDEDIATIREGLHLFQYFYLNLWE